jgi:AcrR family transcriptional regulator
LNIRNIAAKCGIGTGTFYNYFSSKQEVVAAIVMHEWELTLRKMDKGIKMQADCPEKLRVIFTELSGFVQAMHSIWLDDSWNDPEGLNINHIHEKRKETREQLNRRVLDAVRGQVDEENEAFCADALARLFISFSSEKNLDYGNLDKFVRKVLR